MNHPEPGRALVALGHDPRISVRELKELVRARDGYRCFLCGLTQKEHVAAYDFALHVHRLHPGRRYTLAGCVTLCQPCHNTQPKSRPRAPRPDLSAPARVLFVAPPAWLAEVDELARHLGISRSAYIRMAVLDLMRKERARRSQQPPP